MKLNKIIEKFELEILKKKSAAVDCYYRGICRGGKAICGAGIHNFAWNWVSDQVFASHTSCVLCNRCIKKKNACKNLAPL